MEKQEKAYKGVIEYFKNRIMAGELRPGEKLPPEREIAQMLEDVYKRQTVTRTAKRRTILSPSVRNHFQRTWDISDTIL